MTLFQTSLAQLNAIRSKRHPNNFNIVFFGDSWFNSGPTSNNIFDAAMQRAMDFNPLLVICGGDAVFSGTAKNLNALVSEVQKLNKDKRGNRVPFFLVPGNHDAIKTEDNRLLIGNYKKIIGPPDIHWAIDLPEYRFKLIGLNSLYHYIYNQYGLTKGELDFLADRLSPHRRNTFVAMHVPPREPQLDWVGEDAFPNGRGRREFYRIVTGKVSRVLVSHIHDFQIAEAHGVKFILSGGGGATLDVGARFHIVVINIQNFADRSLITPVFVPVGWHRATEPISP